jgi:DNA-binding MarR family transcriptional regulator
LSIGGKPEQELISGEVSNNNRVEENSMPVNLIYNNPWLNAYMLIRHTYYSIDKCEDELYPQIGLTSQQLATLLAIKQAPDPVTQADVANWLDRDAASITSIIDNMSKNGLVERKRDLKDRRAVRLIITRKGEKALDEAREPTVKRTMAIMSCLSEEETRTLNKLLKRIRDNTFEIRKVKEKVKDITPKVNEDNKIPWPLPKC